MHALKELRIRKGLSLALFAKKLGWSKATLVHVEKGGTVTDRLIGVLAERLKLSIDDARRLASGEAVAVPGGANHGHAGEGLRDPAPIHPAGTGHQAG